jgi:hypothetical protein
MAQRGGSGFLGSALTTAAGVAGGMLAFNAIEGLFSNRAADSIANGNFGAESLGGGFDQSGWAPLPDQASADNTGWGGGVDNSGWQTLPDQTAQDNTDTGWQDDSSSGGGWDDSSSNNDDWV